MQQIALSEVMRACAYCVEEVLEGRSLTEALAATPAPLRAAAQSISFYTMRRLGLAMEIRSILVKQPPRKPLLDGLILVSLSLLDTAINAAKGQSSKAVMAQHLGNEPKASADGQGAQNANVALKQTPIYAVHTVVDQAVRAVGDVRSLQTYKGLINGVLRRFIREREALLAEALKKPQARWNHPDWWVRRLKQAYPQQWQALLAGADVAGPMTLRVNRRKMGAQALVDHLTASGIGATCLNETAVVVDPPRPVLEVVGFEQGWWSVQDSSAQQAAVLLQPFDGARVLDACAAPGGKAAHLLEIADIELVALDNDAKRLERVKQNFDRLDLWHDGVSLQCADAADTKTWWDGRPFDLVLADVPCTASGVLRRHPDIRWLRREADIGRTAKLQQKLIAALWKTVRPGGRMLYATCSIFPQEGELQAQRFVKDHANARRLYSTALNEGSGQTGLPVPGQILPLPDEGGRVIGDGFFYALFIKQA